MEELIKKINALAKKSKEEGLTEDEKAEQAKLRQEYLKMFRQGMENTLSNVYIMDEKSNIDGEYLITKFNIPVEIRVLIIPSNEKISKFSLIEIMELISVIIVEKHIFVSNKLT